jgi:serine/threonine protein kinase
MLSVIGKGAYGKVLLVKKKEQGNPAGGELYAMKVLKKSEILRRNQVEHTMTERRILVSLFNINTFTVGYRQTPFYCEDGLCFLVRN